ncbi:MAG: hypothetical protein NTW30_01825, partial [Candidatus Aenigmarchaeota archaeon]|nr:hypothetical protein [Candidatus Aenigmarchaeota archaeon]
MKTKILILLPIVFSVGLLLGHLMLVLASVIIKNPGHTADQINAGTFADDDNYIFKSGAKVGIGTNPSLTLDVNGDVRVGGARISFTGVDGTGYSWIRRSYIDDTNILLGWDSKGNTRIPSGKSLITSDQTCPTGWNCEIKTWDIAAQSGQFYGDL